MWRVRFNSDSNAYDAYFGNWHSFDTLADGPPQNGMNFSGNISIGLYTCVSCRWISRSDTTDSSGDIYVKK
jgi:1,4-alpha-glucan branching enzyme